MISLVTVGRPFFQQTMMTLDCQCAASVVEDQHRQRLESNVKIQTTAILIRKVKAAIYIQNEHQVMTLARKPLISPHTSTQRSSAVAAEVAHGTNLS